MSVFQTKPISDEPDDTAPDGMDVRVLAAGAKGSMAHFELAPGETSSAMVHQTVEELWFITAGEGELWRKLGEQEEITEIHPGLSFSIPVGTHFQLHNLSDEDPMEAVAVTMPPWPGEDEAIPVPGKWADWNRAGILKDISSFMHDNYKFKDGIKLVAKDCGQVNAFWNAADRTLTVCYEIVDAYRTLAKNIDSSAE